jgi:CubicO group peptidase (beta-lactamase class C family)
MSQQYQAERSIPFLGRTLDRCHIDRARRDGAGAGRIARFGCGVLGPIMGRRMGSSPGYIASLFILFILSFSCSSGGQTLPANVTKQIDELFVNWDSPNSPGCALGVYQNGSTVYERGYGMANLNDDVPISPLTVFHVASMSKQFTAASIIMLADEGKLSLDDDVHKYIPELKDFGKRITIRHLLHHTSGLRDQWELLELAGWRYSQDLITDDDVMSVVTRQKDLNFKPGSRWVYSNTNYTLLGLIVKRVSGLSLREFTTKNIFQPLGMTHTHFRDDHEEIIKHDALGYEAGTKGNPFRMSLTNFDTVGATSLHTTVEDLQRWDENFYHPRAGGPQLVQQMLEPGKLNNGERIDYASGLVVGKYKGLPTVSHAGGDAGYSSVMTRFPEQHFSAAVLCNTTNADPSGLARQIADIVLAKDFKSPEPTPVKEATKNSGTALTMEQMNALSGMYWNRIDDDFEEVQVRNGKLQMDLGKGEVHALRVDGDAHLHFADVPWGDHMDIRVVPGTASTPGHLEQTFFGQGPTMFAPVAKFTPTEKELADYGGAYVSKEIDPIYRIVVRDGRLNLTRLKHHETTLRPATGDAFTGDIGTVRFMRDVNQHVSGFLLTSGRIHNLRFIRQAD